MKKTLLALLVIIAFASSSFAGVSYLTAPSVGVGNWAVLGMYATNHNGDIGNGNFCTTPPQNTDSNSLGARGEYGVTKDIDLLLSYTMDTLPNIKDIDDGGKQTSGSTMAIGGKYSLGKQTLPLLGNVVDTAAVVGYEKSSAGVKGDNIGSLTIAQTTLAIGYVISKQMDNLVPYGAVAYKMLNKGYGKSAFDDQTGVGLAFNIGCMIGIAKDQAIAVEYNTENQNWTGVKKPIKDDDEGINVSGISLGYVYMF